MYDDDGVDRADELAAVSVSRAGVAATFSDGRVEFWEDGALRIEVD